MQVNGVAVNSLFPSKPGLAHLNHGSFGQTPTEIADYRTAVLAEVESEPDQWFRHTFQPHFHAAADALADLYRAPRRQMTLVDNATVGVATVLISLDLGEGDEILLNSFTYGTVKMQCEEMSRKRGVKVSYVDVEIPFSHEAILRQYETALQAMKKTGRRVAVLDHISSQGSLLMPLEDLLRCCERHEVLSLVDGAHAHGQLTVDEVNLSRLRPDFYTSNLHKWGFVPRGCAFLYVSEPFLDVVGPVVVSWLHNESFRQRFTFRGTFDTSAIVCIPAALIFTEKLGGVTAIREFVSPLIRQGTQLVMDRLGGSPLCSEELSAPFMISFFLGKAFDDKIEVVRALAGRGIFQTAPHRMLRERGVVCPVFGFLKERCVFRVCAHVQNSMKDFEKLADALESIGEELKEMTVEDAEKLQTWDWREGKEISH